jgi:hypothetical protein
MSNPPRIWPSAAFQARDVDSAIDLARGPAEINLQDAEEFDQYAPPIPRCNFLLAEAPRLNDQFFFPRAQAVQRGRRNGQPQGAPVYRHVEDDAILMTAIPTTSVPPRMHFRTIKNPSLFFFFFFFFFLLFFFFFSFFFLLDCLDGGGGRGPE